jgi:hypothetical protein
MYTLLTWIFEGSVASGTNIPITLVLEKGLTLLSVMLYYCESDYMLGKIIKKSRPNPTGQDIHLNTDGTIRRDEDLIISAQRIFKHNWYKEGGPGWRRAMDEFRVLSTPGDPGPMQFQNKMQVTLTQLTPVDFMPLLPAPSVKDDFSGPAEPTARGLTDGPLQIVSNYRGYSLYLENGALVYRSDPKSTGGNGMVSIPVPSSLPEPETCFVRYMGKSWTGVLNFV